MTMEHYTYEPSAGEVALTEIVGGTLLKGYYRRFARDLPLQRETRVLDYCAGSGLLAEIIAARMDAGQLVAADVSRVWWWRAVKRLAWLDHVRCVQLAGFDEVIHGGEYDVIVVHFALHDFPPQLRPPVLQQLLRNLQPGGVIHLREPVDRNHGMPLFALINLLEASKQLAYEYRLGRALVGRFVDVRCWRK